MSPGKHCGFRAWLLGGLGWALFLLAACNTQSQIQNAFSPGPGAPPLGDSAFSFLPSSFDFGPVAVLGTPKSTVITLTNTADRAVYVASILGSNSAGFILASDTCPRSPQAIAVGQSCTATLQFSPAIAGALATTLNINYGPAASTSGYISSLSLTGTGIGNLFFGGITAITPVTTTTATINWTQVSGAIQYLLYDVSGGSSPTVLATVDSTQSSYVVTGLTPSTTYSYEMRAMDVLGNLTPFSAAVSATTDALGSFQAIANLSTSEGGSAQTPALTCSDIYSSAPTFSILSQSDPLGQCIVSGNTVSCSPGYHTQHLAWTSSVDVQCALNGTNYSQTFTLNVADTNRPPALTAISNQTVLAGTAIAQIAVVDSNTGTTQDIDLDPLLYSCTFSGGGFASGTACTSLPGVSTLGSSTGLFNWTPNYASAAGSNTVYTIVITASDQQPTPLTSSQTFTVTVTPATPILTTIGNYNFPNGAVTQGTLFTFDFNNIRGGSPGNDSGMTYACVFDRVVDGVVNPGSPCAALPGSATFNTGTGIINWTPDVTAWGPYEIKVTGTDAAGSDSEIFVVDVVQGYVTTNLRGNWDAEFATLTNPSAGANSVWKDLTSNSFDATLGTHASWTGSGSGVNPYAVNLDGSSNGNVDFDGISPLSGQTQMLFTTWVSPLYPNTANSVILGNNANGAGSGFTLRQSASQAAKVELMIGQSYQDAVMALAPVGYWRLGEASSATTAIDISGNNLNGTYNSVTLSETGALTGDPDTAASFNGTVTSNVDLGAPHLLTGTGSFTLAAWVNLSSTANGNQVIVTKGSDNPGGGWGMSLSYFAPGWRASVVTTSPYQQYDTAGGVASLGVWAFIVGVYDVGSQTVSLYQNGTFISSVSTGISLRNGNDSFIGTGQNSPFSGLIDEVAMFPSVLTAPQIETLYQAGLGSYGSICYSQSTFASTTYNFLAGLYQNGLFSLFVNGHQECQQSVAAANFTPPTTGLYAGGTATGTYTWNGTIADLKVYGTSNGDNVATAGNVNTDFNATADRFRQTPENNLVTTNLVLNLDAANSARGLAFPGVGCTLFNWFDTSIGANNGVLNNFSGCVALAEGWNGTGIPSDPYRLTFSGGQGDFVLLATNPFPGLDYTIEVWFATTSDGVLFGDQNSAPTVNPNSYNPILYIDASGILRGGAYNGTGSLPVVSTYTSAAVNDGNWHQAVVTGNFTAAIQTLYLDGNLIGSYSGGAYSLAAYSLIGRAKTQSWTGGNGGDFYYSGSIAKVAGYSAPLTQTQIRQNCNAIVARFSGAVCH